jgi:anti-sigma B factor antagonist
VIGDDAVQGDDPLVIDAATAADGAVSLVRLQGEVDAATGPQLERVLAEESVSAPRLVIDCTGLSYIDSTGFRLLHRAALRTSICLVVPPGAIVARMLELGGLEQLLPIFETVEEAIADDRGAM